MPTIGELSQYIRYQLSELAARNGHHEFEHIARHFSRLRISERIIPATGPVGSGGDSGRDFESYRSYLASTPIADSTFLSRAGERNLVFGCSIKKKIVEKIKDDLKTIAATDQDVHEIYYFCEQNLPIGTRQKLQKLCRDDYRAELTIFDGQALAENLTSPDVFWIAEKFLGVPAEMYPQPANTKDWYARAKLKWLEESHEPFSFAEFAEIKSAVRRATFNKDYRSDLQSWIKVMEKFRSVDNEALHRRATYEICVASLRGLNDLTSRKALVAAYFEKLPELREISDLTDAQVLLSYCSTAMAMGHFDFSGAELHKLTTSLVKNLDSRLKEKISIGRKCDLLEIRGSAESLYFRKGEKPELDPNGMFAYWEKMLRLVPNAALFPLDHFADILTALAPYFGEDTRFQTITNRTDKLIEKRSGAIHAAEKARDRAIAFLDNDKILLAVRQLHVAKIKWFSSETLRSSIVSMLLLADCYTKLGLVYAAKQYCLASAKLALQAGNDDDKDLAAKALRYLFNASYLGGEWFTCLAVSKLIFAAHNAFETELYDLEEHKDVAGVLYHLTIIRLYVRKLQPSLEEKADAIAKTWPLDEDTAQRLATLLVEVENDWKKYDSSKLKRFAEEQLFARPFLDLGRQRVIEWRSLGVHWLVEFANERETVAVCEEVVATLQILLADLGTADLLLLPTTVRIEAHLTPAEDIRIDAAPSNAESRWHVALPRRWLDSNRDSKNVAPSFVAIAATVLGSVTALANAEFSARMNQAVKDGLFSKTVAVRAFTELFLEIFDGESFERSFRHQYVPLFGKDDFLTREQQQMSAHLSDGIGYSKAKSHEFIKNRYRRAIRSIRLTLPRLIADSDVGARLWTLREKGHKDWEIILLVANMAMNYRTLPSQPSTPEKLQETSRALLDSDETEASAPVPTSYFTQEEMDFQLLIAGASVFKTWGLHTHLDTPDLKAIRRLLESRYHQLDDDVPHEELPLTPIRI